MDNNISPFASPVYVMLKPAGAACNLSCEYCYYTGKSRYYPDAKNGVMSVELLERFIVGYLESQSMPCAMFTWHGGEALLRPLSFYRAAVDLQKKYAGVMKIDNCIQTNGTLLTDEWCRFLKENNFLVGISIDGPQEFHDEYRRSRQGNPSFYKVMKGVELLKKHGVEYNAMAVVNDYNVDYPLEFYNFFKGIECRYIQFTPIVERIFSGGKYELAPFAVDPLKWGEFLCSIFDEWVKADVGAYFVQLFDAALANWMGVAPGVCTLARTCGHAGVMEFNGDVYACDHFVYPEYRRGNIYSKTITEMMYSPEQIGFGNDKFNKLPPACLACDYLFACNGECPKNRFSIDGNDPGLNYLCRGYKRFFSHVAPYMDFMKRELLAGRPAGNVMGRF
jgi:uncharacterized protein